VIGLDPLILGEAGAAVAVPLVKTMGGIGADDCQLGQVLLVDAGSDDARECPDYDLALGYPLIGERNLLVDRL
jgi:hypothetical protein